MGLCTKYGLEARRCQNTGIYGPPVGTDGEEKMIDDEFKDGYDAGYRRGESERVKLSSRISELQAKIDSMQELIKALNDETDELRMDNRVINELYDSLRSEIRYD